MKHSSKVECAAIERRIASYHAIFEMVETARDELSDAKEMHMDRDAALAVSIDHLEQCMTALEDHLIGLHWSITAHQMGA